MNRTTTISTLAKTQPPEPLLEHEIRLGAYDAYQQQGRTDADSVEHCLHAESDHAEAEILGKIFSRGDLGRPIVSRAVVARDFAIRGKGAAADGNSCEKI